MSDSKQQVQIHLQGDFYALSPQRRAATVAALASVMKIAPKEIEVHKIYQGSIVFDLRVPVVAAERFRSQLQTNNAQLRLLGVERVLLERKSGLFEAWVARKGKFNLTSIVSLSSEEDELAKTPKSKSPFFVPGIWRFHLIYLFVTLAMGLSIYPYSQFVSLLLISGVCAFGILLAFSNRPMAAHVLAVSIGLGAPVVVLAFLLPVQTVLFFLFLIFGITMIRRFLF